MGSGYVSDLTDKSFIRNLIQTPLDIQVVVFLQDHP